MKQQNSSIVTLALILAAGGTNLSVSAQTAADKFPMPTSVASGTKVQIDGSSSMQAVNQGVKERFQKQFSGTEVGLPAQYQGSDKGVQALAADKLDVAGIGRQLTKAEQAQGLAAKTIGRSKIAIIVKDSNPYTGNLTLKDFAKIYRGEVKDWSQLPNANGAKGAIKVIDRPDSSDTRRAFANYPVFQTGGLKTGANAQKLTEDTTQAVVDKLGNDGIGYAPVEQIKNISGIRAVALQGTQPDNPKYPISQPLVYAYKNKGGKVSDGAKAFLGYLSNDAGKAAIAETLGAGAAATAGATDANATPAATPGATGSATTPPGTTATGGSTATTTPAGGTDGTTTGTGAAGTSGTADAGKAKGGLPWWLLAVPVAVGGLWWALGRKGKREETPVASTSAAAETSPKIAPLYPPPPVRSSRGDGLSGDLSGDLSSGLRGGYSPSGDLRSGDLRSGDLSGTIANPPIADRANVNLNGVVDPLKNKATDLGLAGGAAIAGGAAAAAALGKGILDSRDREPEDGSTPQPPNLDLSNPLEGLKDKSSNLIPNLDVDNPLEGIKDKASDVIQDGGAAATAAGAAAVAGGAALIGGAGNLFADRDRTDEADLNLDAPNLEVPDLELPNLEAPNLPNIGELDVPESADLRLENLQNPLEGIGDRVSNPIPDVNPELDLPGAGIVDRVGDFIKDGGAAAVAAGGAAVAGGAALFGGLGQKSADDAEADLPADGTDDNLFDFDLGNPLDAVGDKAAELKEGASDLIPEDPFNFDLGNPLDAVGDKAAELKEGASNLIPEDPFNFDLGNPLDAVGDKAAELKEGASDLIPEDPFNFDLGNPLDAVGDKAAELKDGASNLTDKAGEFFQNSGAAIGAAGAGAIAGGAALFGRGSSETAESKQPDSELDTFESDLAAINLDELEEDPFAGLSDLLGEETGDMDKEDSKTDASSNLLSDLQDKAGDLFADGKNIGGAALAGGAAAAAGLGGAVQSFFSGKDSSTDNRNDLSGDLLSGNLYSEGQITLVSPNPTQVYTHWEIPVRLKRQLREQGGQKLAVRLYDVTDVDPTVQLPTTFQEFDCSDSAWDLEIPIDRRDRRYLTEIGYVTEDNRWLMLARSAPLWVR